jgi:hypothetical protein
MLSFQVRGARVPTPARPPRSPRRPGSGGSGLGGCARVFLVRLHGADAAVYGLLAAAWACGFAGGAFMVQWRWVFGHGLCGRGRRRVRLRGRQVHHAVSPHVVACMSSSGPTETEQRDGEGEGVDPESWIPNGLCFRFCFDYLNLWDLLRNPPCNLSKESVILITLNCTVVFVFGEILHDRISKLKLARERSLRIESFLRINHEDWRPVEGCCKASASNQCLKQCFKSSETIYRD